MNRLVGYPVSPFVRKVRVALETKQIAYDLDPVVPYTDRETVRALNPAGTVPVFVPEGEAPIPESADIVAWSEARVPLPPILPPEGPLRDRALAIQRFADTRFGPVFGGAMVGQRIIVPFYFGKAQGKEALVTEAMTTAAPPLLDEVAKMLGQNDYVAGQFSIADVALSAWIRGGQIVGYTFDDTRWPMVAEWLDRCYAQPGYAAVIASEEETDVVRWARQQYAATA